VPVVVASGDSSEQLVLGKMTVQTLKTAGYTAIDKTGLGSPQVVRAALDAGNVDLCWEYTGDTWMVHLGHDFPIADPQEVYEKVRGEDALNQISWLAMAPCQHVLALLMREKDALDLEISTVSDLARYMAGRDPNLRLCIPPEFYSRGLGIQGLESVYRLRFVEGGVRQVPMQEGYQALQRGDCDCALGLSADKEIQALGLTVLKDDRGFFQASNLAVAVRTPILQQLPNLERTLARISALLTQEAMAELQREVIAGDKPETVARRFLAKNGVIRSPLIPGRQGQ
jgi:osmoprotectant transport system substrate-binding protein